ncbi:ABC transporter permease [Arthrobacter sp. GCM10027362]|uniref:ABC transporter permease n=1 Tax=Arthrobacter sp. GCM10027362 TaxID=3273379 RepID=UPI00362D439C
MTASHPRLDPPAKKKSAHVGPLGAASRYYLQIIVVVLAGILSLVIPTFSTGYNIQNILTQASFSGLIACGMTLLIAGGLFDLSVAGMLAVVAVVTANVLPHSTIGLAIVTALVTGTVLGVINGLVVTKAGISPFIATLGMFNVYLALAFILSGGQVVPIPSVHFQQLGTMKVAGIPLVFLVFAFVCLGSHFLLHLTHFGRRLRAVGSSETAARMAGIRVDRVKITAFAVTGLFTAVAAVGLSGLLSSANATMASGMELSAIAIAVVGGTALRGGQGTLLGTFTAALFMTMISTALNLLQVSSYWQYIATGIILIVSLILGSLRRGDVVRGAS